MNDSDFIQAPGVITKSTKEFSSGGRTGSGYKLLVAYNYRVDDRWLTSDKYSFGQSFFSSKKEVDAIIDNYKYGQKVTVYVSKKDHDLAVLKPQINSNSDFSILLVFMLFAMYLVYRSVKKRWVKEDKKALSNTASIKKKRRKR